MKFIISLAALSCVLAATDVVNKLDTKSLDVDLADNGKTSASNDVVVEEKKHRKSKSGSVTEIKPKGKGNMKVEDVPDYMKESGSKGATKDSSKKEKAAVVGSGASDDPEKPDEWHSFIMSVSMIIVSEIGDKTFLIAALMAMRSPRLVVFSAAATALVLMTILSGIVGHTLPALIPQRFTQFLASVLFVIFGIRLFKEGMQMSNEVGVSDEMAEVEEEIAMSSINDKIDELENGSVSKSYSKKRSLTMYVEEFKRLVGFVLSPTWVQVFVLTFLGEWGDRSQIATIALAAGSDYWFVILGGCVGHSLCTAGAVLGGMFLASKISMKQVTLGGAVTFFIFAILYLYEAVYGEH